MGGRINIWKYVGWYALGYAVATLALGAVAVLIGGTGGLAATTAPFIATFTPVARFVSDFRTIPTRAERRTLFSACVGFFLVVQSVIVLVVAVVHPEVVSDVLARPRAVVQALVVGVALQVGLMWLSFRFMPAKFLRNLLKSEAKKVSRQA
ncbi:ABZJ_00895 family protein [Gordonia liuliyuniae]|uniref:ABZJ_00895 family protein n=1 Tax=Gordonia liuliyuniae TaxID=2911517 RepID=A0ABS9INY1_9ACTN|nr:ABZJ_00895 family protein [Gordonia liuliyuniae]MCF8587262.1 ABZJ_00895 family protein [Gordonia liuliyuniae]